MKQISILTILLSLFLIAGNAIALPDAQLPNLATATYPIHGESDAWFTLDPSPSIPRIDWIVSQTAIIDATDASYNFVYSTGNSTDYNGSLFFFYYQLENVHPTRDLGRFTIDLQDSLVVLTAGYITDIGGNGISIDNAPFNHLVAGETVEANGAFVVPSSQQFTPVGDRSVAWNFDPKMDQNESTTVLFLTCMAPPAYTEASTINGGQVWAGKVPAPTDPDFDDVIPEPMSMILLGSAVCGLVLRKRNK